MNFTFEYPSNDTVKHMLYGALIVLAIQLIYVWYTQYWSAGIGFMDSVEIIGDKAVDHMSTMWGLDSESEESETA